MATRVSPGGTGMDRGTHCRGGYSLGDHLGQKGGKSLQTMEEPDPIDVWPPRSKTPRRGRRDASMERSLAEAKEAHQRALATAAALEEEIEQLSRPITRGQS